MSKRILKIAGGLVIALALVGLVALAGAGLTFAAARTGSKLVQAAVAQANPMVQTMLRREPDDQDSLAVVLDEPEEEPDLVEEPGVVVASVVAGGAAAKAGVARGDILLKMDDKAINRPADLSQYLGTLEPGDQVKLTVRHGDAERTLTATLGDRNGRPYLGLSLCSAPGAGVGTMTINLGGAMILEVVPGSPADKAGLKTGEWITTFDGQALAKNNLADLVAAHKPGDTVTLEVGQPGGAPRQVSVKLGQHPENKDKAYLGIKYRVTPQFRLLEKEQLAPFQGQDLPFKRMPSDPSEGERRFEFRQMPLLPGDEGECCDDTL